MENNTPNVLPIAFSPESYQPLPSILLNDLTCLDATGKPKLKPTDIVIYAILKAHARSQLSCYPSYGKLAQEAGCSPSAIKRSLQRLEAAGHILRKAGQQTGKIFLLTNVEAGKVVKHSPEIARTTKQPSSPTSQASGDTQALPEAA